MKHPAPSPLRFVGLLLLAGLMGACAGPSRLDSADAGRTLAYEPGLPNFDLEALATWRGGEAGVDVYLGLPAISLVFVRRAAGYEARFERALRLRDRGSNAIVREATRVDTVRVATYEETQAYEPLLFVERLATPTGSYVVEVTVTDNVSDKLAVRRQAVEVERAVPGAPHLSRVRLEAWRGDGFAPVVSMHVPADLDSLRAIVELSDVQGAPDVEVAMHLLRFPSDTTVAAPPYWLSPQHGSLPYRGVRYDRADTLQVSRRALRGAASEAVVEFDLPPLAPGLYRVEMTARVPGQAAPVVLEGARDLSVKPPAFPHLERLPDLVAALAHIAFEDEIEKIQAADTPAEMKRRFDAFWGARVPNRQAAANLIKLYYGRVEEANLFFTSYKEGWKTDRGMVYIIFGPPYYAEDRVDTEVWYYSYGDRDPARTYVFDRVRSYERDGRLENYILLRRTFYQHLWNEAVDRWRSGQVL